MSNVILNPQQMPKRPIRSIPFNQMKYLDMLIEIQNVNERLQMKRIPLEERRDLYKYLKKLNREVYEYEEFRGIPHTVEY